MGCVPSDPQGGLHTSLRSGTEGAGEAGYRGGVAESLPESAGWHPAMRALFRGKLLGAWGCRARLLALPQADDDPTKAGDRRPGGSELRFALSGYSPDES